MRLSLTKTAVDERGDALLAREARWLRELEEVAELDGQVPRVLDEGTSPDGRRFLVISVPPLRSGETRAFTPDHARFLASLGKARFRVADFECSGCGGWLHGSLQEAESRVAREEFAVLSGAFHDCETRLLYWTGPYVLAQGDFAPWNIRRLGPQLFVTDWGLARAEASPLDDVLHFLMAQRALSAAPVDEPFLRSAMKRAHEFAVQAYPEWNWRPQVLGALTLVYLLGSVLHHTLAAGRLDRSDPVAGAYWRLLDNRSAWIPD